MCQWIKHGSTTTHLKQKDRQLSGQQLMKSRPKRSKTQQWAGKVMASIFWDAHGILFTDYLEKGKTINSDYCTALLYRLSAEMKKKRPHMQKKKVLFHQDNAPCHKSMRMIDILHELRFELLPYPPHSRDLAPSDYWLFVDLKKCSRERDLAPMKKWLPKLKPILRAKTNHSTKKASKS